MTKTEKELEREFLKYENFVVSVARREFERVVKPWLIKRGFKFLTGNGTYLILDKDRKQFDPDDAPEEVRKVFQIEIPGMRGNDLGSLMPDFDD